VSYLKWSYLKSLIPVLAVLTAVSGSLAQTIYLDPADVYITSGPGSEFDLTLKVDEQVIDLKLFTYYADFDGAALDTVAVTEGALLPSSGGTTIFNKYIVNGNNLQLEGLILGGGIAVDGPGVLADLRMRADNTGIYTITPNQFRLRDVNGDFMDATGEGCTIYVNAPPYEFNLLQPVGGEGVTGLPGEYVTLEWEATTSPYPGEGVVYNLDYGTSPTFAGGQTTSLTGLTGTTYQVPVNNLTPGTYYWRVRGVGVVNGYVRNSTPASTSFAFAYEEVYPTAFALLSPVGGVTVTGVPGEHVTLDWQQSTSAFPGENIWYQLDYGTSSTFEPGQTTTLTGLAAHSYDIPVADLPPGTYFWRVSATGDVFDNTTASSPVSTSFAFEYTYAPPGAFGLVSPADEAEVGVSGITEVVFDWDDAAPQFAGDLVEYTFYLGPNPGLPGGAELTLPGTASQVAVPTSMLPRNSTRYWTVQATNSLGQSTWADDEYTVVFSGCCVGRVGDANSSGEDEPTIGDINALVSAIYTDQIPDAIDECFLEADVNQSGGMNPVFPDDFTITDINLLIEYLYIKGPYDPDFNPGGATLYDCL